MNRFFLQDVAIFALAQGVAGVLAFLYTIVAARWLGVSSYGLFQALMGIYGTAVGLITPLNLAVVHCVSVSPKKEKPVAIGQFLFLTLVAGAGAVLLLGIFSPLVVNVFQMNSIAPLLALGALLFIVFVLTTLYGALQGSHRYPEFAWSKMCESALCLVFGTSLIGLGLHVAGAVLGYVCAMTSVVLWIMFKNRGQFRLVAGYSKIMQELKPVSEIFMVFGVLLIVGNMPVMVARARMSNTESGLFGALYNLRNTVWPFAFAVSFPLYSRMTAERKERGMFQKALAVVTLLGGGFLAVGFLFPELFLTVLYGSAFLGAAPYLALYGCSLTLQMFMLVFMLHQLAEKKLKGYMLFITVCVFLGCVFMSARPTITQLLYAQIAASGCYLTISLIRSTAQKYSAGDKGKPQ